MRRVAAAADARRPPPAREPFARTSRGPSLRAVSRVAGNHSADAYERHERDRPPVARSEHVPRAQQRRGESGVGDRGFARDARGDVRAHRGRWLRDADVDEMRDRRACRAASTLARIEARSTRSNSSCFRWIRMRRSDEVHERRAAGERRNERRRARAHRRRRRSRPRGNSAH